MDTVVWLVIDIAAFVVFALAGVAQLRRRYDAPTLDKTDRLPDSGETDFAPAYRFALGVGVASLVLAVVMFVAVPVVLRLVDVAPSVIVGVVCGEAAGGAVLLFFADRFFLKSAEEETKR